MIVLKNLNVEVRGTSCCKHGWAWVRDKVLRRQRQDLELLREAWQGWPLLFEGKGKGKGKNEDGKEKGKKGKEKGKGKEHKKEKEKGNSKGKGQNNKGANNKGKGSEGGNTSQPEKPKDPKKYDHIKCYNCNEYGHFSKKCPKPKMEKANAALLEPQLAGAVLDEPQLFAVALDIPEHVPVVSMCVDDSESECLSDDDPRLA